ncbi:MAG: tetratricopeptide repeat protein [Chloroflexota bacterium]
MTELNENVSKKLTPPPSVSKTINGRYILQEALGQGGMGIVYRATDRLTGEAVALKRVHIPTEYIQFMSRPASDTDRDFRVALAQEFQILAGLRHPHIISVLDYGFDTEKQPFFTMNYLSKAQTVLEAGGDLDRDGKLELIRQMLQALAYLHRRGIVHRDLKPSNVLVANGLVHVLDFGLSISLEGDRQAGRGGSLLYMAPELLHQEKASIASDMYAVGVMAYELFAGHHPFDVTSGEFAQQVHHQEPDLILLGLDHKTETIIGKLLAKKSKDRYNSDVEACLTAISRALGEDVTRETEAIRESFLQAATFVGRDLEVAQLQAALNQANAGQAAVWLIGGESGVGKSRLIEEFRIQALVSGWQVLAGQAVAEGGLPYQMWRDIVPHLALNGDLSELEAGILQPVVPNIGHLLGRFIPDPPVLEGAQTQQRLVLTLITILQRQTQPTLLLLEDLHWARESLAPLKQILKMLRQLPNVLVVGTYRNDEHPNLSDELIGAQTLTLDRLPEDQIAQLSQAMLGPGAIRPEIIALLTQETEGNTFFIVEVMRALAEEAGQLDEVGRMTLPIGVFTSGMKHLLHRRIERMSRSDQAILQLAAVAGRRLDLPLLQSLAPQEDIALWLQRGFEAAVLTVRGDRWLFAHDKLQETILAELEDTHKQILHCQIAEAIEQVYPKNEAFNQPLLDHWHQAHNKDKELHYLPLVVQHLIEIVADYTYAHQLLERGLQMLPTDDDRRVLLLNWQVNTYLEQGSFTQAQRLSNQIRSLAQQQDDQAAQATSLHNLGLIAYHQGQYEQAQNYYQQSLVIRQAIDDQLGIATTLGKQGLLAGYLGMYDQARDYYEQSLTIRKEIGDQFGLAASLNDLGVLAVRQKMYKEAHDHYEQSLAIRQAIGDQRGIAGSLGNLGIITFLQGAYEQARDYHRQSLAIFQMIGAQWGITFNLNFMGQAAIRQGNYAQALTEFREALAIAQSIQSKPLILTIVVGFAWLYLQRDQPTKAAELTGLTLYHPTYNTDVKILLDEFLPVLESALPADTLQPALERGKTLDLEGVVQQLLNEFSNDVFKR